MAQNKDGSLASPKPGIILGKELALRLGLFVGNRVNVVSPVGPISALGMTPKIRPFQVVGIFESGMYEYDSSLAYISLQEAQKFFSLGNTVTGIEVKVEDVFTANVIATRLKATLGAGYSARDWMELNRNLFSALKLEKTMMFLLLVLITLVASFNIVGTAHHDRQRETTRNSHSEGHGRDPEGHHANLYVEWVGDWLNRNVYRHSLGLHLSLAH